MAMLWRSRTAQRMVTCGAGMASSSALFRKEQNTFRFQQFGFYRGFTLEEPTRLTLLKNAFLCRADAASRAAQLTFNRAQTLARERLKSLAVDEATTIRMEAFYRRNRLVTLSGLGSVVVFLLWKVAIGVGNLVTELSGPLAQLGLLVLVGSSVACTGLVIRTRHSINPETVYNIVMQRLHCSPGFMEVMGKPVVGGKVRAYFTSGGDLKLKELRPKLSCNRCFIVFPAQGSERRAMVSSEVTREDGQYQVKPLTADVFMPESDVKLYLIGSRCEFEAAGVLLGELTNPVFKALAAQREFDVLDDVEAKERREMMKQWLSKLAFLFKQLQWRLKSSHKTRLARSS